MTIDGATLRAIIAEVARRVIASADELGALDRAIGDGDHGLNMKRGFEAVMANLDAVAAREFGDAIKTVGTTLVMKVGGASGPLYGTLFMSLGKDLHGDITRTALIGALTAAIEAVKARGKSDVGQKSLLDVLVPLLGTLGEGGDELSARIRVTARTAAEATIPMRAACGRASFLGERSIGHMDPGARSSALIAEAIADVMEGRA
jgi:phosphoenolpyruvate---glycerone phosphotransferase subunit DhaL